jgi:hypothetical protein
LRAGHLIPLIGRGIAQGYLTDRIVDIVRANG